MTDRRKGDPMLATFDPLTRTYSDGVVRTDTAMEPDPLSCWKHSWICPGLPCPECAEEAQTTAERDATMLTKAQIMDRYIRPAARALALKVVRGEPLDDFEQSIVEAARRMTQAENMK